MTPLAGDGPIEAFAPGDGGRTVEAEWFDDGWLYVDDDDPFGFWVSDDARTVRLYERTGAGGDHRFRPVLENTVDEQP